MALPSSGSLSFSQINTELGRSSTAQISMGETAVRSLFGRSSGEIGMNHGLGKFSSFNAVLTIASDTTNYNLRSAVVSAGWNQTQPVTVTCTINSGVTVYATSTGSYAFQTGSPYPAGSVINIINNGTILGKGGDAGAGGAGAVGGSGATGGPAFYAAAGVTVTNNGRISGGGGGGGGGGAGY